MKNILVISTSLRRNGNSDKLAEKFCEGAMDAGHTVEKVSLIDKSISFCKGCLVCQKTKSGHCVINDDADDIIQKMKETDSIVFATPIYYYEMTGQMKTLLDRANPLFPVEYAFRDIYLLSTAADEEEAVFDRAIEGLKGWIECFPKAQLKGVVKAPSTDEIGSIMEHQDVLEEAYHMGQNA